MFSSYHNVRVLPLETLGISSKNGRQSDSTQPMDSIYPILWGKKRTRFLAIYS